MAKKKELTHTEKIQQWLEDKNRDHAAGISLFNELTKNKRLVQSLAKDNKWGRDKLAYLLEKEIGRSQKRDEALAADTVTKEQKAKASANEANLKVEKTLEESTQEAIESRKLSAEDYAAAPDAVKAIEDEWKAKYAQRAYLQANIEKVEDETIRADHANTILDLGDQIQDCFDKLAYYKEHGTLPEAGTEYRKAAPEVEPTLDELKSKVKPLTDRISRLRKKVKDGKATDEDAAELAAKETEKAELDEAIAKAKANG